ncbi:hypothetical protein PVAND_014307 [Polypedilum vanderplanki]|nr:hypothetical protein PVAND_014307 [Polypedilum vanderplanki]
MDKLDTYPNKCVICNRNGHYSAECNSYIRKTKEERKQIAIQKHLCFACLITTEHTAEKCDVKRYCGAVIGTQRCVAKHHISLHTKANSLLGDPRKQPAAKQAKATTGDSSTLASKGNYSGYPIADSKGNNNPIFTQINEEGFALLTISNSTAQVESSPRTIKLFRTYVSNNRIRAAAYAVGDSAAEISLVKRSLVDALGITGPPAVIGIHWTDESSKNLTGIKVNLPIKGILPNNKEYIIKDCYAIDDFNLPPRSLNVEKLKNLHPYLQNIPFESYENAVPAILLGSGHASLFEAIAPIWENGSGNPIGILTKLGYSIYGGDTEYKTQRHVLNAIAAEIEENELVSNDELSHLLEASIALESLQLKPPNTHLSTDERSAIEQAQSGLVHSPSGFIQMPLIWRMKEGKKPKLPDNFPMVLRRQLAQEKKLSKKPELLQAFNDNFKEAIDEGYARAATAEDMRTKENINYVPMSLVINANKRPVKTRNVYDASAKYKGTSLNLNLLTGPNLLIDLLKPLMSMRENQIAFTGDIKSMFPRIKIDPKDQNCQRILWRENLDEPMQIFIFSSMLFGPSSSPFQSQFAKNWIADQFKDKYPSTSESIKTEVYMDDWFSSAATTESAINRIREGIEIFAAARMQLVGIQSNSPELLSAIPIENVKKELIPLITELRVEYVSKVLGVNWDTSNDEIIFEINSELLKDKLQTTGIKPTKRELCSLIARIFDVLGLLAHCIIRARILLQRTWKKRIDWDQEIEDEEAKLWSEWLTDIKKAATVRIPRQRSSLSCLGEAKTIELHTFCDAGKEAMATVAYIVAISHNRREPSCVIAKSKVTPLKIKNKTRNL